MNESAVTFLVTVILDTHIVWGWFARLLVFEDMLKKSAFSWGLRKKKGKP